MRKIEIITDDGDGEENKTDGGEGRDKSYDTSEKELLEENVEEKGGKGKEWISHYGNFEEVS